MPLVDLEGQCLITTEDMSLDELYTIMARAKFMKEVADSMYREGRYDLVASQFRNRRIELAFFEPSSRTYESFTAAAQLLGCHVSGFRSPAGTSLEKGESWQDTIMTLAQYNTDLLVIRHPEVGSAEIAARICNNPNIPVINAGDGNNQHPTQALLDIMCLLMKFGGFTDYDDHTYPEPDFNVLAGKTIAICGDLKNGRTLHSGLPLYRLLGMRFIFCAPDELQIEPPEGVASVKTDDLKEAMASADILYMTRIQWERPGMQELSHLRGHYKLNREMIIRTNPGIAVMHPLPRIAGPDCEIDSDVDQYNGALYFTLQVLCGMWTRMALISLLLPSYT